MRRVAHLMPAFAQQSDDDLGHGGIVLHQQDAQRALHQGRHCGDGRRVGIGTLRQRQSYPEPTAPPGLTGHLDVAAHRQRQFAADRQAQAAATVACSGARSLGLFEALEESTLLLCADARAGVGDLELDQVHACLRDAQADLAVLGELGCVAHQV